MDRHAWRPACRLPRPTGGDACHARDLGPCQRLPDLPGAAPAAAADRQRRCPRRLALQGPLPSPLPARPEAGRATRGDRTGQAAAGLTPGLPARAGGSAPGGRRPAGAHRQGIQLGRAARGARHAADRDRQCLARRSLPGRGAVPLHGQHGVELGHEPGRDHAHARRQGPGHRHLPHPAVHLCRLLPLRDRGLCRPGLAGYHLSRALGLHLAARSADRHRSRPRRRDPAARGRTGPRCAAVPGGLDRPGRAPQAACLCPSRRRATLSGRLSRLSGPPSAQARHRAAGRLARDQG